MLALTTGHILFLYFSVVWINKFYLEPSIDAKNMCRFTADDKTTCAEFIGPSSIGPIVQLSDLLC